MLLEFAKVLQISEKFFNDEDKIRSIIRDRLIALGHGVECPRCMGSGYYSYHNTYGTVCFRCGGRKYEMPRLTKKLLKVVEKEVAEGKLEPYFQEMRNRQIANDAVRIILNAWKETSIESKYDWGKAAKDKSNGIESEDVRISNINAQMASIYDQVEKLSKRFNQEKDFEKKTELANQLAELTKDGVREIKNLAKLI